MTSTTSSWRRSPTPRCMRCCARSATRSRRQITALGGSRHLTVRVRVAAAVRRRLAASRRAPRTSCSRRIPAQAPSSSSVTAGAFAEAARAEFDRYRAVYPDFPVQLEVRDDVSELMVSFGRLLIPESAAIRAERVEPLLHHEVGTHVVTFQNGSQAAAGAADDRAARLRRDPGGSRRARRVPGRRPGPAPPARARRQGRGDREDAGRRGLPGDLRLASGRLRHAGEDRLVDRHPGGRRRRFA